MNHEIKNAVHNSTLPPAGMPPIDFDRFLTEGPHTLATIAAALTMCPHPKRCHVSAEVQKDGIADTIHWCGACGAMGCEYDEHGKIERAIHWERPAFAHCITFEQLDEVASTAKFLTLAAEAAREIADMTATSVVQGDVHSSARELEKALRTIVALALFAEIRRTRAARERLAGMQGIAAVDVEP